MRLARALPLCLALVAVQGQAEEIEDGFALAVHGAGQIKLPQADFRADWTVLGTWIVAGGETVGDQAGAAGLHVTYTQPGVAAHYRATGEFPDGTVLVKELFAAETREMTTGVISHAAELEGWFVMVKDREGRFPGNPLWGDGWGWGYFSADAPDRPVTEDYAGECLACHVPAQETDWVYVWGYPVLQSTQK
ncbi:MAG: cytochrome P460 family protein [Pseudomonadota bacterium]